MCHQVCVYALLELGVINHHKIIFAYCIYYMSGLQPRQKQARCHSQLVVQRHACGGHAMESIVGDAVSL